MGKIILVVTLAMASRAHAALNTVEYSRLMTVSAESLGINSSEIQPNEELRISTSSLVSLFSRLDRDYRAHDLPTFSPDQAAQNFLLMASCNRTDDTLEGGVQHPVFTARCLSEAIARSR